MYKLKLSGLLTVCTVLLCLLMLPADVQAASDSELTFSVNADGSYTVYRCDTNATGEMVIPATVNGKSVTAIGTDAFKNCTGLTSVVIPDSVTSIAGGAFAGCSSLYSITVPFVGSSETTEADAYQYPFGYIFGSTSYTGGEATRQDYYVRNSVYSYTFYIPSSLRVVTVTGGNILYGAFSKCSNLRSITLPDGLTTIGISAFNGCSSLSSITIPGSVTEIRGSAFRQCKSLQSITIPESVTKIGNDAFFDCTDLISITLPDTLTSIGEYAFNNTLHYNAQADGVVYVGKYAVDYKGTNPTSINIKAGTLLIADKAFGNEEKLTSVSLPTSLTSIGISAFHGCSSLNSVSVPSSVKNIADYAFARCEGLTEVHIPNGVVHIGSYAFYCCTGLQTVTISQSVTHIGSMAFDYCIGLTKIEVDKNNAYYSSDSYGVLFNKDKTQLLKVPGTMSGSYSIPDTVTCVGHYAFSYVDDLTTVIMPNSVTTLEAYSFYSATGLTALTVGSGLTSVESMAFAGASKLATVFYRGTENQRESISVSIYQNNTFTNAAWHYEVTNRYLDGQTAYLCGKCNNLYLPNAAKAPLKQLTVLKAPDDQSCCINGIVKMEGISLQGVYADGTTVVLGAEAVEKIEAELSTLGKKTAVVTALGATAEIEVFVHPADETISETVTLDSALYPESAHNYASNMDQTQTLTYPGASMLILTFSSKTELENRYDYIYIYDKNGTQLAKYTGVEASGCTLSVQGDTFSIKLTSDGSNVKYGYSFASIQASIPGAYHPPVTVPGTAATCTQDGLSDGSSCEICQKILQEQMPIAALGHEWQPATCTKPSSCVQCGQEQGEALGHTGQWFELVEASCTTDGIKARICETCGETESANIPATGHSYTQVVTAPTCTEQGYTTKDCTVCGDHIVTEYVAAKGHSWGAWITAEKATCAKEGVETRSCETCGETESANIPTIEHSYTQVVTAPTCTEQGYTTKDCTVCGDHIVTDYVAAKGHGWSAWVTTVKATCTKEGSQMRFCTCGVKEKEVLAMLPHSYDDGVCTTCGIVMSGYVVLSADMELTGLELTEDLYIDLNGFDLAGTITTNGYKIYGMDSTTDGYTCAAIGYMNLVDENGNEIDPVSHFNSDITGTTKRYMAIKDENGWSFHRFYLGISHLSLKPTTTGVGYKGVFYGDRMVAANLGSFGFTLQLQGNDPVTVTLAADKFVSGKTFTLRIDNFDVEKYGETALLACATLQLADGTVIQSTAASMTMRSLMEQLNTVADTLSEAQLTAIKAMIEKYVIIKAWNTANLY